MLNSTGTASINKKPKITFGIIVLNGEPFTKYCLRSLYKFAHQIIVVEGATENAKAISTPEGHSLDGTLQSISDFIRDEDPDHKVVLVTKNGFWKEKDEQSKSYVAKASGDYLWQIDIDEFYREEDMEKVMEILSSDKAITAISFKTLSFWGGVDYISESPIFQDFHRLFKFGPGYTYVTHRPPTVTDESGVNLRNIKWIDGEKMVALHGIYLYHYSLVFPRQVEQKSAYYKSLYANKKDNNFQKWADENFFVLGDPFHVHNTFWRISWLRRFHGRHPRYIDEMMRDIHTNKTAVALRNSNDIEKLLSSKRYLLATFFLRLFYNVTTCIKNNIKKLLIYLGAIKRI